MFFEWAMWQFEVSKNIKMSLTTLDIIGDYMSRRAVSIMIGSHVKNMLNQIN